MQQLVKFNPIKLSSAKARFSFSFYRAAYL